MNLELDQIINVILGNDPRILHLLNEMAKQIKSKYLGLSAHR